MLRRESRKIAKTVVARLRREISGKHYESAWLTYQELGDALTKLLNQNATDKEHGSGDDRQEQTDLAITCDPTGSSKFDRPSPVVTPETESWSDSFKGREINEESAAVRHVNDEWNPSLVVQPEPTASPRSMIVDLMGIDALYTKAILRGELEREKLKKIRIRRNRTHNDESSCSSEPTLYTQLK